MSDKNHNRIAGENIESMQPWILPPVNDNGRVLSTAEKEAKERKAALLRKSKESVQTIELPDPTSPLKGMTAEELEKIFSDAEEDGFTKGHAEGFEKGRAEGYEAGHQQGMKELREQLVSEQMRFKSLVEALMNPLNDQDHDIEQMLLETVCTLTQHVIQREMQVDSTSILDVVKTAVEALPVGSKNIRIILNPQDFQLIETFSNEQQWDWKFLTDEQLTPGGCRVETPESRIDFSISSRLQRVLEEFLTAPLNPDNSIIEQDE